MSHPKNITIAATNRTEKPTLAATEAIIGPVLDGSMLAVHFVVDHVSIPSIVSHDVDDDTGRIHMETVADQVSQGDVTREVQATVLMSPESALRIGKMIATQAQSLLDARGK